jgi:hypothetical protein
MLICNYSYINQICGHVHSGVTNPLWIISPHAMRGYYGKAQYESIQEQIKRDGFPTGTNAPYSIIMGDKGALLSATTTTTGTGTVTSGLSMGKACEASLTGSGTISSANLSLIVQLAASLSGSGTITTASLVGVVSLAASLSGTGSLTAGLNVIAFMNTTLTGTSSVNADLKGTLSMSAAIYVNQSEATVQQIVDGVWNGLATAYNNSGTMGELLNNTGGGASPATIADAVWDEILSAHNISGSTGEKLSKLLEKIQFLYLKD